MRRLGLYSVSAILALGCSSSHSDSDGGTDGAIVIDIDAQLPDGGRDGGPVMNCGNRRMDPGEQCDDGNTTSGDGCDATCQLEAHCGDGNMDAGEVCDDGNIVSGDGCRSDCQSDETCGNGIVDTQVGEVCESTTNPMCATDCMSITGCGDGTVSGTEGCDDGGTTPFDGCGPDCQTEVAMVLDSLAIADPGTGCDFSGDGRADNRFARVLGIGRGFINDMFITPRIADGTITILLAFLGLDDRTLTNDPDFRIAWLIGQRGTTAGTFSVMDPTMTATIQSILATHHLTGGPETIPLPVPVLPIDLEQGRMDATTNAALGIDAGGLLCGGIPTTLIAQLGLLLGALGGGMPDFGMACDGGDAPGFLDVVVGGGSVTVPGLPIPIPFTATAPDLDLDGDGLEDFTVLDTGPADCQPVIVSCKDGDGTTIDGRGCYNDPRIADGYSAAFEFSAVAATLVPAAAP